MLLVQSILFDINGKTVKSVEWRKDNLIAERKIYLNKSKLSMLTVRMDITQLRKNILTTVKILTDNISLTFSLDCRLFFVWLCPVSIFSASSIFRLFLLYADKLNSGCDKIGFFFLHPQKFNHVFLDIFKCKYFGVTL